MSRKNILSESCLNVFHGFYHPTRILKKIRIHLSEHSMRWVCLISSMIIRSKCEDKTIFFLCFENNSSPLRSSKSIELNSINTLIDECLDICLKSCYSTQLSPAKIGMSHRENALTERHNSLCDTCNWRGVFWCCHSSNRISSCFIEAVMHDFSRRSIFSDSDTCCMSFFPEVLCEMSIVEIIWIISSFCTFSDKLIIVDRYFVFCEFINLCTDFICFSFECLIEYFL